MNYKSSLFYALTVLMIALVFSSCGKESIDELETEIEEVVVDEINCDSIYVAILQDPQNLGNLSLEVLGGTAEYSYLWSTGAAESAISVEEDGTYSIVVTDSNGCSASSQIVIDTGEEVNCDSILVVINQPSQNSGDLEANVYGGQPAYTYEWSNGSNEPSTTVQEDGTYSLTVTDAIGCSATSTITVNMEQPINCDSLFVSISQFSQDPGDLSADIFGGQEPYLYEWSNGEIGGTINVDQSGVYSVTVTDANGCSVANSIEVEINGGVSCDSIVVVAYQNPLDPSELIAEIYGGQGNYIFEWSNGVTGSTITVSEDGTYSVTVIDVNGCSAFTTIEVSGTGGNSGDCSSLELNVFMSPDTSTAQLEYTLWSEASGGTSPYFYLWSTGQQGDQISVTQAGEYSVTATDANGCTIIESISF